MPTSPVSLRRLCAAALLVLGLAALSGCGGLLTFYASLPSHDEGNDTAQRAPASDAYLVEVADRFGLMALFAEVVYRRDIDAAQRDGQGCRYLLGDPADAAALDFGMPRGGPGEGRWRRWIPPSERPEVRACDDVEGLYYETYVHENGNGKVDEAVIAFRGTENRSGQYWADWRTNVVASMGLEPAQYALARERLPTLIAALSERFALDGQPLKLHAVGHSLGGGLAQQAGYLSAAISEVYTFNTSPVTNWSHLRLDGQIRQAYPTIYRVYHGGEILEKLRFVTTSMTRARYGRHDIGLQLEGRRSFAGHDMKVIACNFAQLLASREDAGIAHHHYPVAYVRDEVLRQEAADEADRRRRICVRSPAQPG